MSMHLLWYYDDIEKDVASAIARYKEKYQCEPDTITFKTVDDHVKGIVERIDNRIIVESAPYVLVRHFELSRKERWQ